MNLSDIRELYRYHDWATGLMLSAVQALPAEALTRELGGSFKSIRDVVAHVVGAEWVWLERWRGQVPTAVPEWFAGGDVPELCARLADVVAQRNGYLVALDEAALARTLSFRYISGRPGEHPLADVLFHVANHGTYHRGQLASMLRQVGGAPPSTDFTVFKAAGL